MFSSITNDKGFNQSNEVTSNIFHYHENPRFVMNRLIQQIIKRNLNTYDINHRTCIIVLTIREINPKQQTTNVLQISCINAMKENSDSMFFAYDMILLCF